jgi:hypothetical protein
MCLDILPPANDILRITKNLSLTKIIIYLVGDFLVNFY